MSRKPLAKCPFKAENCFAHTNRPENGCKALENTSFKNGICPFFKTKERRNAELIAKGEKPIK